MGHSAPPTQIRYHGQNGQQILSAGKVSLFCSGTIFFILLVQEVSELSHVLLMVHLYLLDVYCVV